MFFYCLGVLYRRFYYCSGIPALMGVDLGRPLSEVLYSSGIPTIMGVDLGRPLSEVLYCSGIPAVMGVEMMVRLRF